MKIKWNQVTWYSKTLALAMFIIFPILAFYLGIVYQKQRQTIATVNSPQRANDLLNSPNPSPVSTQIVNTSNQNLNSGINATSYCIEKIDKIPCVGGLIVKSKTGMEITRQISGKTGKFKIFLNPGNYNLEVIPQDTNYTVLRANPQSIVVNENQFTSVEVTYWTGLRSSSSYSEGCPSGQVALYEGGTFSGCANPSQ